MNFKQFNQKLQEQFAAMQQYQLFRLNITGQHMDDAWVIKLKEFKKNYTV